MLFGLASWVPDRLAGANVAPAWRAPQLGYQHAHRYEKPRGQHTPEQDLCPRHRQLDTQRRPASPVHQSRNVHHCSVPRRATV
ncbi:hypothetical protein A5672_18350 [Mycobacterium alsense]|uniref:Secreted protein n=1 Tax=Mycobacterium alsense TaxID=324058 RepID=A0ABD6P2P9_9MYCO|nr:hypothetical protein [Mycobacterium alsense]OBG37377.1 hypothetical protein A5672_18350 [Mycobacterium alsense]